jgi:mevalonate kinase
VVYGEPAVAVPLSALRLSVVISAADSDWVAPDGTPVTEIVDLGAQTLERHDPQPFTVDLAPDAPRGAHDDVARALGAAAHVLGLSVPLPVRVSVRTGGLSSGMGTSAALGTALARALLLWHGEEPDPDRVLKAAAEVEAFFHGSPSGIDHTVSALERPLWFEKGRPPEPLDGMPPLRLVLWPRRAERTTRELVDGLRERIVDDPSLVRVIADLGRWTREGRDGWAAGRFQVLAAAMEAQHAGLDRLGVVAERDRTGVAAALEAGAMAAKITGAGGGGTLLAMVADADAAAAVSAVWPDSVELLVRS